MAGQALEAFGVGWESGVARPAIRLGYACPGPRSHGPEPSSPIG